VTLERDVGRLAGLDGLAAAQFFCAIGFTSG